MSVLYFDIHRRRAFIYLLLMIIVGGVYFFISNTLMSTHYYLALVDISASVVSSFILFLLITTDKLNKRIDCIIKVYLSLFYVAILLTLQFVDGGYISIYTWVFLVPPLSYLLLGRILGMLYTAIFIVCELMIFYGHFWDSKEVNSIAALSDVGFCLLVVWSLTHLYEKAHTESQEKLLKRASEDSLTGLLNRSALNKVYENNLGVSIKNNRPLSIVIFDIDWFKNINDTYGHDVGDKALCFVADSIRLSVREGDSVFRLGGEEFCVCLPSTDAQEAHDMAEVIRSKIEHSFIEFSGEKMCITISAGIASVDNIKQGLNEALRTADQRLYKAKHLGRNQIIFS